MSSLKKSQRVEIRVSDYEKSAWAEAAGGTRRVSEWLRALANEAANEKADPAPSLPEPNMVKPAGVKPPGKALHVGDAFPVGSGPDTARLVVKAGGRVKPKAPAKVETPGFTKSSPGKCPRWMHHRPGSYCGSCRKSF